jgi:hypothetical protein
MGADRGAVTHAAPWVMGALVLAAGVASLTWLAGCSASGASATDTQVDQVTAASVAATDTDRVAPQGGPSPESPGAPNANFASLDANGDGSLTEDEVPADVWEGLTQADADADGAVTLDELKAAAPEPPDGQKGPGSPEDHFASLDANGDGSLTEDEVPADEWARISQADADSDGAVTLDELKAAAPPCPAGPHGLGDGPVPA